jgi:hypothetical protein
MWASWLERTLSKRHAAHEAEAAANHAGHPLEFVDLMAIDPLLPLETPAHGCELMPCESLL